jgi:hypothetical protein
MAVRQSRGDIKLKKYLMAASTTITAGDAVMLTSGGLAVPAAAAASNNGVVGCAQETVVSAASGNFYITVGEGQFRYDATSIAQASVGDPVYFSNATTMDETQGTNEPRGGKLVEVISATEGWVEMALGGIAG